MITWTERGVLAEHARRADRVRAGLVRVRLRHRGAAEPAGPAGPPAVRVPRPRDPMSGERRMTARDIR